MSPGVLATSALRLNSAMTLAKAAASATSNARRATFFSEADQLRCGYMLFTRFSRRDAKTEAFSDVLANV